MTRKRKLILQALQDAADWQYSLYDAHHGSMTCPTKGLTKIAMDALKQRDRYKKLQKELLDSEKKQEI